MGDYADDAIERDMQEHIDFVTGRFSEGINGEIIDNDDFDENTYSDTVKKPDNILYNIDDDINENINTSSMALGYLETIKETDKAWHLKMNGGAITWFSKQYCRLAIIDNNNMVIVPKWLLHKIAGWK